MAVAKLWKLTLNGSDLKNNTMAEIKFTGNKSLKSINREWCAKFPYLYLAFFDADGKHVNAETWGERTHASVRGKKDAAELSTTATMHVGTFEQRYEEAFGCKVEIYHERGGRYYQSLKENNHLTLSEYNQQCKEKGAGEFMKVRADLF